MAESLRKQLINLIRYVVAENDLTVDTGNASLRQTEFLLLSAILKDADILPVFGSSESQEGRIEKCYRALAAENSTIPALNSTSLLERQVKYLLLIAADANITFTYDYSWSQLYRKLKVFDAVKDDLIGPCKDNLLAWNKLNTVEEIGSVWGVPNKMPDPANYIGVIGAGVGVFDGIVYGISDALDGFVVEGDWEENVVVSGIDTNITQTVFDLNSVQAVPAGEDAIGMPIGAGKISFQLKIDNNPAYIVSVTTALIDITEILYGVRNNAVFIEIDGVEYLGSTLPISYQLYRWNGEQFKVGARVTNNFQLQGNLCCLSLPDGSRYDFVASKGNTEYSIGGNHLTLVNPTLPDFWGKDDTGTIPPILAIEGCFLRSDGAYVPKGADTSAMTGVEIQPFQWADLPYEFKFEDVAAFAVMNKNGTGFPSLNGVPIADELTWTYAELDNIPALKDLSIKDQVFVKTPVVTNELLVYSQNIIDPCRLKTLKYIGALGGYFVVQNGTQVVDELGDPVIIGDINY